MLVVVGRALPLRGAGGLVFLLVRLLFVLLIVLLIGRALLLPKTGISRAQTSERLTLRLLL